MRVIYDTLFARITGCHEERLSPSPPTVGALVEYLSERYGPQFREAIHEPHTSRVRSEISLLLNGQRGELDSLIGNDDEVAILIPLAGG